MRKPALPGLLRFALALLVLASVAACSNVQRSTLQGMRLALGGKPELVITPEQVASVRYAQIRVDGPDGSALMVLGNLGADGLQYWYSPGREVVYLRDGLLAGSHGLGQDADAIRLEGSNPFARLAQLQQPVFTLRRYDWMPGYRYGVQVEGRLQRIGTVQVDILGTVRELVHFREDLQGPGVEASNEYWADPETGFIWKSRQLLAPGVILEIQQLKPYLPRSAE